MREMISEVMGDIIDVDLPSISSATLLALGSGSLMIQPGELQVNYTIRYYSLRLSMLSSRHFPLPPLKGGFGELGISRGLTQSILI